jgi:DNA-binding XRE family transcriptional regulator
MQVEFTNKKWYSQVADSRETESMDNPISPRQCRAARAWLGWTQRELAAKAGMDMQTVMHFEMGRGAPRKATALALMVIFLQSGISLDEQQNLVLPQ